MNGCNVYLDQIKIAHFVGQVSNEGNGFAGQIEMDLGGVRISVMDISMMVT